MTDLEFALRKAVQHINEDKELYSTIKKQLTRSENTKIVKDNLKKTEGKKAIFE